MDVERIIDEIRQLQEMFEAPYIRPLSASDLAAANRRHDEMRLVTESLFCRSLHDLDGRDRMNLPSRRSPIAPATRSRRTFLRARVAATGAAFFGPRTSIGQTAFAPISPG